MKTIFFRQTLQSKSNLKNPKYSLSAGCQLTKIFNLMFYYETLKEKKAFSDILRKYAQEKEKFNLDLKIYKENFFDITVSFQKRTDVLFNGFEYCDATTQKQETIDFYDYHYHLKNFGFTWEHGPLEFKYKITLFADKKALTKNYQWLNLQDIELRQISL